MLPLPLAMQNRMLGDFDYSHCVALSPVVVEIQSSRPRNKIALSSTRLLAQHELFRGPESITLLWDHQYHMTQQTRTFFAPELHIPNGTTSVDFYLDFGAKQHFCFRNDDGSIHVAELELDGAIFHLHETMRDALEPASAKGVTSVVGLFVDDVHEVFNRAISAGATVVDPVTDHDYGYRQGMFKDPFGHLWQIQKRIG